MATRQKTIHFAGAQLNTLADNTLTAMPSFTAYIPEFSGVVTIRKAIVVVAFQEAAAMATGNYSSRRIDVSVGGAGATSYTNSNLYTGSGEQTSVYYAADATTHFTTNWTTGTSKTIAISVLIDTTATNPAFVNVSATLYITYDYDDTQPTQIKTVWIPLNAPVGALATTKPASIATIPALDTELPESTKTYRNMAIIAQGNVNNTGSTTDSTITMQVDTLTAYTSQTMEMGATSDWFGRWVWNVDGLFTTNATHDFFIWASVARHNHIQAYLQVTYEFDATSSSNVFVSLMLPMEINSPMGGTTSSDYQRGAREVWIQEPGTITTKQVAYYMFYDKAAAIAGLNCRIGTGSFVTYTDGGGQQCGSDGLMIRNDSAFTLARGRNSLNCDVYRTDTADLGWAISGFWIVNYTAGKPTQGYGAANRTIFWNLNATFDGANALSKTYSAQAPSIPDDNYFFTAVGINLNYIVNSTGTPAGFTAQVERLSGEGGILWENAIFEVNHTDPETGLRLSYGQLRDLFARWRVGATIDPDTDRLDIETSRRWRVAMGNNAPSFYYMDLIYTMHNITYTVSGSVTGSAGGTVTLDLHRVSNGEKVMSTTRTGNGSYSMTWFDNTEEVFVSARESGTLIGRSEKGVIT